MTDTQDVSHFSLDELHISEAIRLSSSFGFLINSVPWGCKLYEYLTYGVIRLRFQMFAFEREKIT